MNSPNSGTFAGSDGLAPEARAAGHPGQGASRPGDGAAEILQALPAAIYTCDPDGYIRNFNAAAEELWGRAPVPGVDRWCGSGRIFHPDGTPMAPEECPMALTLREGRPVRGREILVERSDGTLRQVLPHPDLLRDPDGRVTGAINMLMDVTDRKREAARQELASRLPLENPSPVMRLEGGRVIGFTNPAADSLLSAWKTGKGGLAPDALVRIATEALAAGGKRTVEMEFGDSSHVVCVAPVPGEGYVNLYFNDITELKRARQDLRLTEMRFRTLAMHSPVAIFTKDPEGRYLLANPEACKALGVPGGVEGRTDHEMLPVEHADAIRAHDLEVIRNGAPVEREEWVRDRRYLATKFPMPGPDGKPSGVCGVCVDITARSKMERLLRDSEERFRTLANHAPVGIFRSAPDGDAIFVNDRWCEMAGMSAAEAAGKGWMKTLHPDDLERVREEWALAVAERRSSDSEFRFLHPDGTVRWIQGSALPLKDDDGNSTGYIGSCADITGRKRSEQLLERQAKRLRLLWEAAGVILTADDPDVMLQRVFGTISDLLGVDTFFNFVVDETGDGLELYSCRGVTEVQRERVSRIGFGEAVCGTVARERRAHLASFIQDSDHPKCGFLKEVGLRAYACNPLVAGDDLVGTLSFGSRTRDQFEADEIEFMETISHYVTGAYVRLKLVENLRAGDRKKDEFLATLAHELRNPLAPIRTGLEVMRMSAGNPEVAERVRGTMERQLDQMVRLVNDLLDVSRITRGKLQLRKVRTRVDDIVRSATEASRPLIDESGHVLEVTLPEEPVLLDADPHRLAQVISNLLNNAARYTPRGGVISLEIRIRGELLEGVVRDNGIGIPPEMTGRIFEMFEQVGSASSGTGGGLGIGLTLVRSLVGMHGGKVRAESAGVGQGSSFWFELPVPPLPAIGAGPVESPAAPEPAERKKVLIVDDNEAAVETMRMAVELMGHEVRCASSGGEALRVAGEFSPEVVLMDLGMPGMDGWEAARRIRSEAWGRGILLIALTGWGRPEDREKTRDAGFDRHLVKPACPDEIRGILSQASPGLNS